MKAANEEILSSNEELQSTNEELETAKEELQSSNEELVTLNDELQHRNAELSVLTHDLSNLLVGVDIPVLVLDAALRVRRFTPVAGTLLNLIPGDVGRPFSDIASNLDVSDWEELFSEVTGHGRLIEREVSDRKGHRYSLRVRPYKTGDDRIEGVLVVMLDTDLIYRARDEAQKSARLRPRHRGNHSRGSGRGGRRIPGADRESKLLRPVSSFAWEHGAARSFFGPGAGQFNVPRIAGAAPGCSLEGRRDQGL